MKTMSELCTIQFFESVESRLNQIGYEGGKFVEFISTSKSSLVNTIKYNYNMPLLFVYEDENYEVLAKMFTDKYARELSRMFDALYTDYGVFDNTDVKTNEEITNEGSDNLTHGKKIDHKGSDTSTKTGSDSYTDHITTDDTSNSFTTYDNASEDAYKPTSKSVHKLDSNGNTTYGTTNTTTYNSYEENSGTDERSMENTTNREIHRKGNIGITPNQRLAELELILRVQNSMFNYIIAFLVETFSSGVWEG